MNELPLEMATQIAEAFHYHYENLAPEFAYTTRQESAVPWQEVPESNRALMVATVQRVFYLQHVDCAHAEPTCPCGGSDRLRFRIRDDQQ